MTVPKIEFLLQRTHLEAGRDQTVDLLIRVIPPEIDSVIGRRPKLNLSVVLDRSGSMGGEKMERDVTGIVAAATPVAERFR